MNLVVDTHVFIWLFSDTHKINNKLLTLLKDPDHRIFVSNISFWEISLKYQIAKLSLSGFLPDDLPRIAHKIGLDVIDIDTQTIISSYKLSQIDKHKDPFDRLLIWFCIKNRYTLVSLDKKLTLYKDQGLNFLQ